MNILEEIRLSYRNGDLLAKLIYINVFSFLAYKILIAIFFLLSIDNISVVNWIAISHQKTVFLQKPWTFITFMFFHESFFHLLFNLLGLYFGGKILVKYMTSKQLVSTYFLGGLTGALFYILSYNYLPAFDPDQKSIAYGASASVLAIIVAISTYVPSYQITLTFLGRIKLKYIAIAFILLDINFIPESNTGGHLAHLGGALFGFYFASRLKKGKDITKGFNNLLDSIANYFKQEPKLKTVHRRAKSDQQWNEKVNKEQKNINLILDKISKSGYESLTKSEKETLFKASKK
ncbi:MAG: rhomboid family intramembrane serine protease [Flavobacteriales bacterium]